MMRISKIAKDSYYFICVTFGVVIFLVFSWAPNCATPHDAAFAKNGPYALALGKMLRWYKILKLFRGIFF